MGVLLSPMNGSFAVATASRRSAPRLLTVAYLIPCILSLTRRTQKRGTQLRSTGSPVCCMCVCLFYSVSRSSLLPSVNSLPVLLYSVHVICARYTCFVLCVDYPISSLHIPVLLFLVFFYCVIL